MTGFLNSAGASWRALENFGNAPEGLDYQRGYLTASDYRDAVGTRSSDWPADWRQYLCRVLLLEAEWGSMNGAAMLAYIIKLERGEFKAHHILAYA